MASLNHFSVANLYHKLTSILEDSRTLEKPNITAQSFWISSLNR